MALDPWFLYIWSHNVVSVKTIKSFQLGLTLERVSRRMSCLGVIMKFINGSFQTWGREGGVNLWRKE